VRKPNKFRIAAFVHEPKYDYTSDGVAVNGGVANRSLQAGPIYEEIEFD
jgi:hypothetical protein